MWVLVLGLISLVPAGLPALAIAHGSTQTSAQIAGPCFIFPTNGQTFPYGSALVFQVQHARGATGYLWGFVKGNTLVWQNLDQQGALSPATYTIQPGSRVARALVPGDLEVRVRAHLTNDHWTSVSTLHVNLKGKTRTHPPTPTATPVPQIHAGDVLYTADVTRLYGGPSWKHTNGMLVNDGAKPSTIVLPYHIPVADYAVEAEIQLVTFGGNGGSNAGGLSAEAFGLRARMTAENGGYWAAIADGAIIKSDQGNLLGASGYTPDTNFHTYRLEVRGNHIRLLVDGSTIIDEQDNHYLTGDEAGIFDNADQINVRAIRIIAL